MLRCKETAIWPRQCTTLMAGPWPGGHLVMVDTPPPPPGDGGDSDADADSGVGILTLFQYATICGHCVLCCSVSHCIVLCCAVVYYAVLCCPGLDRAVQ